MAAAEEKSLAKELTASAQKQVQKIAGSVVEGAKAKVQEQVNETTARVQRIPQELQSAVQSQAKQIVNSTVEAAKAKVQEQVDGVKRIPQDTINGIVGFAKDRVQDRVDEAGAATAKAVEDAKAAPLRLGEKAKQRVELAAQGAAVGLSAIPGQLVSSTQRTAGELGGQIAGALQARAEEAVRQTLNVPAEFVDNLAKLPDRVSQAILAAFRAALEDVSAGVEAQQQAVAASLAAQRQATAEAVSRAPGAAAGWVQAGVEQRVLEAAEDTTRLVQDIGSTPTVLSSAANRAVDRAGQAAGAAVADTIDKVAAIPQRAQEQAAAQLRSAQEEVAAIPQRAQEQAEARLRSAQEESQTMKNKVGKFFNGLLPPFLK